MKTWYRATLVCGLLPLFVGTVVFAIWFWSDLEELIFVGIYVVYGGLALFAAGLVCLIAYIRKARRAEVRRARGVAIAGGILLLNFPVCAAYMAVAFDMHNTLLVAVKNTDEQPITCLSLSVNTGSVDRIGTIPPGSTQEHCQRLQRFQGHSAVNIEMWRDNIELSGRKITEDIWLASDTQITVSWHLDRISGSDYLQYCLWKAIAVDG